MELLNSGNTDLEVILDSDNVADSESFLMLKNNDEIKAMIGKELVLSDGVFRVHYEKTIGAFGLKKIKSNDS